MKKEQREYHYSQDELDNHANQLNPNNDASAGKSPANAKHKLTHVRATPAALAKSLGTALAAVAAPAHELSEIRDETPAIPAETLAPPRCKHCCKHGP